jgi:hypothetical protein
MLQKCIMNYACMIYSENIVNERTLRHWIRMIKDGCANTVHDEEQSGQSAVCSQ